MNMSVPTLAVSVGKSCTSSGRIGQRGLNLAHARQQRVELLLHLRQAAAAPHLGVEVELDVEAAELGREVVVVLEIFEDLEVVAGGSPARRHQEQLLLGADAAHAGLDSTAFEHPLDGAQVGEQLAGELTQPFGVELVGDVVAAHFRAAV